MEKDIEVLEKLANRTYKIDKDGWETAVCSIDEQLAIRNIIARNKELEVGFNNSVANEVKLTRENAKLRKENKELEDDLYASNCIVNEQIDVLRDSIPKSKVRELREIDNIDLLQFKIKELLQEGDK